MKVALLGYGKMGKAIEESIFNKNNGNEAIEIVLKISNANIHELTIENLQKADVVIEFTTPATVIKNIKSCIEAGVPIVVGTTGWYDQLHAVKDYCDKYDGALLYAANFNIGVNIFFEINKKLAALMSDQQQYKVRVEEMHHTQKLDSPSGTAIKIAEQIIENTTNKKSWVNCESDNPYELEIISHRIENIPGLHEVIYTSEADEIKIVHTAYSRKGFAEGAMLAAKWLKGKKGFFTMKEVLGF